MQPYLNTPAARLRSRQEQPESDWIDRLAGWCRTTALDTWTPRGSEMMLRLRVAGRLRSARLYRGEADIGCGPLFVLLHGARSSGAAFRAQTGHAFDRWADAHGACVVYPDAIGGHWNDGRVHAHSPARRLGVDDAGFLRALVAHLGVQRRAYAVGFANGGHMVWRLAAQEGNTFAGFVAIGANLPVPGHCEFSLARLSVPALLVNGHADRVNLFHGGPTRELGVSWRGDVRSGPETLAWLRAIADPGVAVRMVELPDAGHTVPQPYALMPRRLGATASAPDIAVLAAFFFGEAVGASPPAPLPTSPIVSRPAVAFIGSLL